MLHPNTSFPKNSSDIRRKDEMHWGLQGVERLKKETHSSRNKPRRSGFN